MDIETIEFRYVEKLIVLTLADGTTRQYAEADKAQYLSDTGRSEDVAAIGWT